MSAETTLFGWWGAPSFDDVAHRRRARAVYTIARPLLVVLAAGAAVAPLMPSLGLRGAVAMATTSAVLVLALGLARRGHTSAATRVLLVGHLALVVASTVFFGGVGSIAAVGFPLAVVFAGALLGSSALVGATLAASACAVLASALEVARAGAAGLGSALSALFGVIASLVLVAYAVTFMLRRLERAVETAERQATLAEHERDARVRAYDELAQLARQVELTRDDELLRLSNDLHDQLGQLLVLAKIKLGLAQSSTAEPQRASLIETSLLLDEALRSARAIALTARPPLLSEAGVVPAVRALVDDHNRRSQVTICLTVSGEAPRISPECEHTLFRIAEEALTNVQRHAKATSASVGFEWQPDTVCLVIRDDGVGFDVTRLASDTPPGTHLGLVGIRERARVLGGSLTLDSSPTSGTSVTVRLPWKGRAT